MTRRALSSITGLAMALFGAYMAIIPTEKRLGTLMLIDTQIGNDGYLLIAFMFALCGTYLIVRKTAKPSMFLLLTSPFSLYILFTILGTIINQGPLHVGYWFGCLYFAIYVAYWMAD